MPEPTPNDRPVLQPEENIGPYYRMVGGFLLFLLGATVLGLVAALLLRVPLSDTVVKMLAALAGGLLLMAALVIIRPTRLDNLFRLIISALPFTKYHDTPPASDGGGKAE